MHRVWTHTPTPTQAIFIKQRFSFGVGDGLQRYFAALDLWSWMGILGLGTRRPGTRQDLGPGASHE